MLNLSDILVQNVHVETGHSDLISMFLYYAYLFLFIYLLLFIYYAQRNKQIMLQTLNIVMYSLAAVKQVIL